MDWHRGDVGAPQDIPDLWRGRLFRWRTCSATWRTYSCTRLRGHAGRHSAAGTTYILAVWR